MSDSPAPEDASPSFPPESPTAGLRRFSTGLLASVVKTSLLVFGVVFTAMFASVFGLEVYKSYFQVPDEVEVPQISGKELAEANRTLEQIGLRLAVQESRYTNKYPDRVVISQDPAAGRKVRKNREIMAVVSLGPELIDVPDLKGKTLREARIVLSNSRLRVGKITYKKEEQGEPESILNQNPPPNDRVEKGRTINLEVQKGGSTS